MPKAVKSSATRVKCEICPKPGIYSCPNCNLFHYCSQEHQLRHKNDPQDPHGANCKPIKVVNGDADKSKLKLVTTRKIQDGQIIFHEKPLFIGPSCGAYMDNYPDRLKKNQVIIVCLGCYRAIYGHNLCTKCKWPVCDTICQENAWHKNFECDIFARRNVPSTPIPKYSYFLINILRFLMLEKKDPKTWKKMLPIFKHCLKMSNVISSTVIKNGEFKETIKSTTNTLRKVYRLGHSEFDYSKVKGIMLVLESYGIPSDYSTNMVATAVFDMGMKISMACTPNTFPKLDRVHGKGEIQLSVYSLTPLEVGSQLTRIGDPGFSMFGTDMRREQIMLNNHVICKCERCADPTEFGTYFTSFKCLESGCDGYLTALNPLEIPHSDLWQCSSENCPKRAYSAHHELYQNWRAKQLEIIKINRQIRNRFGEYSTEGKFEAIESMCANFDLDSPNNYSYTWELRHTMCKELEEQIIYAHREGNPKLKFRIAQRLLGMTTNLLNVANKLSPGLTPARAKLMYYAYRASRAMLEDTENPDPFIKGSVEKMGLEALRIMKITCPPTLFYKWNHLRMFHELECCTTADSYDGISLLFLEHCVV